MPAAQFKFHGNLNDFLLRRNRNSWISYSFTNSPALKDAIESIGVPHTEVKDIFINGSPGLLNHLLVADSSVEVYPFNQISSSPRQFILDVHLGKLAKLLRLLGFDTRYQNDFTDKDMISAIKQEQRIVLTRDIGLLKHKAIQWGYWLRSQQPLEQAKEVVQRFDLVHLVKPFTRCLVCNGVIEKTDKEKIMKQLPPGTALYFNEFYQCPNCRKIYWKGSHYERMIQMIEAMIK